MGLLEEIEKDKKALEEGNVQEDDNLDDNLDDISDDDQDEIQEDDVEEIEAEDEDIDEESADDSDDDLEEEKPDNAAFAKLRRELAAEKKRNEELKQRFEKPQEEDEIQETSHDDAYKELLIEKQYRDAEIEFQGMEQEFSQGYDDYNDAAAAYASAMYHSLKFQNPDLPDSKVQLMTKRAILHRASEDLRNGYDPIERIYNAGKQYIPKEEKKETPMKRKSVSDIKKNQKRSSSMASSGSSSTPTMTADAAANMPLSEFAKLSETERRELLSNG